MDADINEQGTGGSGTTADATVASGAGASGVPGGAGGVPGGAGGVPGGTSGDATLPSREEAWALLCEWVQTESLRRHCLAVEASMRGQAALRGEPEDLWGITGLLHDMDYERYPDLHTGHPRMGMAEFERRGYPPELIRGVASHADYLGVSRDSDMEKTLAAVDELSGFVLACAYVRPQGIHGLGAKSVRKKMKQPSFAAAVSREEMTANAEVLGVEMDTLIEQVVAGLEPHAQVLGIDGAAAA